MNPEKRYPQLRTALVILLLLTLFSSFILFRYLLPDYLVKEQDLIVDSGIIANVYKNSYQAYDRHNGNYTKNCLDVELINKPYFIRLSDKLDEKYWEIINNQNNISKTLEVKFENRLLHNGILQNPEQISIDKTIVIPLNSKRNFIGRFALVVCLVMIACAFFSFRVFKLYKKNLHEYHREIDAIIAFVILGEISLCLTQSMND